MRKTTYHHGGIFSRHSKRDGRRYYFIRYTGPDGRRHKEKAGTRKRAAEQLLEQRRTEIRIGTWQDQRSKRRGGMTFKALAKRFLKEYASERRSDYYRQVLIGSEKRKRETPIMAFFGDYGLAELESDPTIFDRFRRHRLTEVGPSTVRKNLMVLGTMFGQARRWRLVTTNPLLDVEKPPEPENADRPLDREEWGRLLVVAEPWLQPILRMEMATGGRLKEVVGLTWENIDLPKKIIYISSDNKTGSPRGIPLGLEARAVLEAVHSSRFRRGKVFLDAKGISYASTRQRNRISQRTIAAMRASGIKKGSFKSLRTTVGTVLGEADHSEVKIGVLLGHSWAKEHVTGKHYIHIRINQLRGLIRTLDDWINTAESDDVDEASTARAK